MNTQTPPQKDALLQKCYKETISWVKEITSNNDELNTLKLQVISKKVNNHIEEQVQKNISIIAKTTQDRLLKDLMAMLRKHNDRLSNLMKSGNFEVEIYQEEHFSLTEKISNYHGKMSALKTRITDFLNRESTVQRHGYSF